MRLLADITLRRGIALLAVTLALLIGGVWASVRITTDYLLYEDATAIARNWARLLAETVPDLEQIAGGESPSSASMVLFNWAQKSGQVFRYEIYNRQGYSQLTSENGIALVNLSEFSRDAVRAVESNTPVVDVRAGGGPGRPSFYAQAYVPVLIEGRPVAVVAAYVDQTAKRDLFYRTSLRAALSLCFGVALAFGLPAIAWYRRTREKQQADRRIHYLAHHDVLTGLANRAQLTERLESALAILPATSGQLAVHFIDLDRFKQINDALGHDGGDFLLETIGERLRTLTRGDDLVARLGGDEFVVLQHAVARQQVEEFAKRIAQVLAEPVFFHEQEISPHVTIGVAVAPTDGLTPERLIKSADLALYAGKAAGRNCIRFFLPEMDETLRARLELERIIRGAVANQAFTLNYQPVFEMNGKKLIGFEALARLRHPNGEMIPPAVFIPLAEELRLIDKIGIWVLREACRTAATWPNDLTVAVNLSPMQFESCEIEAEVARALKDSGLAPERLELEITETLLLGNNERVLATLNRLKDLGVSIVMDDFGTGYSSLSYLWKFPFDKIKIDRSFMQNFGSSERDAETVVKTIIALGRELRMRVTVEGVETANQVDFLYDADADQVQGYYFGRPLPASELPPQILEEFMKSLPSEAQRAPAARPAVASSA